MPWFDATNESEAVLAAGRDEIWNVLTDPRLVAEMTPLLDRIEADGDLWRWEFAKIPVLGVGFTPAFTERMGFTEGTRIDYEHAPPEGQRERTGVDGWYILTDVEHGTHLAISLTVKAELPLSRLAAPAVTGVMRSVMATAGVGFARNLERHLGLR
ncbi:MAG: hypothetical protein ACXVWW_13695 [Nocardioides sp.]